MTKYIEEFQVAKRCLGIELEDGKYKAWIGGCAIGSSDTIEGARELLFIRIDLWLRTSIVDTQKQIDMWNKELRELTLHPAGLLHFITAYEE
jgi:hypothetical protein